MGGKRRALLMHILCTFGAPKGLFRAPLGPLSCNPRCPPIYRTPISERPIFGHADFFNALLGRHIAKRDSRFAEYWMGNCELLELEVPGPQDLLDPPREAAEHQPCEQPPLEEARPPRPFVAGAAQLALLRLKEEIRASCPEMSKAQLGAAAARRWKELGAEERERLMSATAS